MSSRSNEFLPDLIIEVTNGCNMICKGCYAPNVLFSDPKTQRKPVAQLQAQILKHNWPDDKSIEIVSVRGGEPSLNPELPEILEFLSSKAKELYLETNGTWILNNDTLLRSVVSTGTIVKLSLDKMHKSNNSTFSLWKERLDSVGARFCIAITEFTQEDFEKTRNTYLNDFEGDVFWQRKAITSEELIKPKVGVINVHGILKSSVTNKLKPASFTQATVLSLLLLLCYLPNANAIQKISLGVAANFSSMSDSTSNPYSNYFRNAINLAIEDNKAALQKKGYEIQVREFDYGDDKLKVIETANAAINSDVVAVIGYIYSSDVFLAGPIFEKNKLLLLTPTGSADRIEQLGRYVRRSCFQDSFQGQALANYSFKQKNIKSIAIVSVSDCAYCQSLRTAFKKQFEKNGGIVKADVSVLSSDTKFSEAITELKDQKVDAILVPNYEKISATILSSLMDNQINPKYWLGGDGWGNSLDLFHKIIGPRKYKALTVSHWHPAVKSEKSASFSKAYLKKFNKNPVDTAVLAYDAASLIIQSILMAPSPSREGIASAIETINNFKGVTGKMTYLPNQRTPIKSAIILSHDTGKFALEAVVGD